MADYFPAVVDRGGDALGIDPSRRFSGLSGYKKVIESGVEAVALIVPPCFLAEHASAAVAAGLHVYMAKPVAVDVFGCLRVASAGKEATKNKRVFLVDYQLPIHPANIEVAERVRKEGLGKISKVSTVCVAGGRNDPPKTANIESRLQGLVWDNDVAIGGSYIVSYDIHALDAAIWVLGQRPVAAMGDSRICRANPHGDSHDVSSVIYEYADGLLHEHSGQALPNGADWRDFLQTLRPDVECRAGLLRPGELPPPRSKAADDRSDEDQHEHGGSDAQHCFVLPRCYCRTMRESYGAACGRWLPDVHFGARGRLSARTAHDGGTPQGEQTG